MNVLNHTDCTCPHCDVQRLQHLEKLRAGMKRTGPAAEAWLRWAEEHRARMAKRLEESHCGNPGLSENQLETSKRGIGGQ